METPSYPSNTQDMTSAAASISRRISKLVSELRPISRAHIELALRRSHTQGRFFSQETARKQDATPMDAMRGEAAKKNMTTL